MLKVNVIRGGYSPEDAKDVLLNCDAKINIVQVDEIYYPYVKIKYDLKLNQKLAKLEKVISCVIDLVYGRPAVAQGIPDFDELEIDEKAALQSQIDPESIYEIGHDFVFKLFLNKAKILHTPDIVIENETYFHKKFYIVHCKDPQENDYFVLVDSMDGAITILDWKGETEALEQPKFEKNKKKKGNVRDYFGKFLNREEGHYHL